jgi:hypothetical protein
MPGGQEEVGWKFVVGDDDGARKFLSRIVQNVDCGGAGHLSNH